MTKSEILDALRNAKGPDRELDGEIMFRLFAKPVGDKGYIWPEDNPSWSFAIRFPGKDREWFAKCRLKDQETILVWRDGDPILMNSLRVPKLTASLDAAIALVERVRPGCIACIITGPIEHAAYIRNPGNMAVTFHSAATPAIALLIALLSVEVE